MEDLIQLDSPVEVGGKAARSYRGVTVLAILALVLGSLVLARHAPGPVKSDRPAVTVDHSNQGAVTMGFHAAPAQINISAIVCPILDRLIASIPFLSPFLAPVRALFGCVST